jgi:Ca-activated chloride channel family protein
VHLRRIALLAAFPALALAGPWQQPPLRDDKPFRTAIELTSVTVTVRDADGRLAPDLPREMFEVYEDGVPQAISQFTNERVPIGLGVLLDISDSMFGRRIEDARATVDRFLFDLLDRQDEFFIVAFNHLPHVVTGWTNTPDVVRDALDRLRPSGGTAAYDAVLAALPLVARRHRQRGALLIVSDGADTASTATLRDVGVALHRSDAFVYALAIDSPDQQPINTRVNPTTLREITDQSGGRTEVVQTSADLMAASARIAEELNHQYLLGYAPAHGADGKFHSIRVRVKSNDYKVRARSGYVAVPERSHS